MTEEKAKEIAEKFLTTKAGYSMPFIGVHKSPKFPNEWNVLFESVNKDGVKFEGPLVIIVNEDTEEVSIFESL